MNAELDDALRAYLGGDPQTGAIQIGLRDERLIERCGADFTAVKQQIREVLEVVEEYALRSGRSDKQPLTEWLQQEFPCLSLVTRKKLASRATYLIEH